MFSAIMFHHFHGGVHPIGQGSISAIELEEMILMLMGKYSLLNADLFMYKILTNTFSDNEICLTFDDNLKCQYEIAKPILDKYKIKCFWFVYTSPYVGIVERIELYRYFRSKFFSDFNSFFSKFCSYIEILGASSNKIYRIIDEFPENNYFKEYIFYSYEDRLYRYLRDIVFSKSEYESIMNKMITDSEMDSEEHLLKSLWISEEELRILSDEGHLLGLHSHSHPFKMKNYPFADQLQEFRTNKLILESIIKKPVTTVSHPCGSYSKETISILKDLDVVLGFKDTTGYNSLTDIYYEQPRLDHYHLIKRKS